MENYPFGRLSRKPSNKHILSVVDVYLIALLDSANLGSVVEGLVTLVDLDNVDNNYANFDNTK